MHTRVVVVGAGWFGLIAAKTYLELFPDHDLIILERTSSLGGTWSRERVYSGLKTHNGSGALEVASLPMQDVVDIPLTEEGYITGEAVTDYLHAFATIYGLESRIQYNMKVQRMTKTDKGPQKWLLEIERSSTVFAADKVIMATGLTSDPYTPSDIRVDSPSMKLIHSVELRREEAFLLRNDISHVTVYGGSKSAFDTVFLLAEMGKRVDWIIRTSGSGVSPMFNAKLLGMTSALFPPKRLMSAMSPCIFNAHTGLSRFLNRTSVGRSIVRVFWRTVTKISHHKQGLYSSENGRKLIPSLGPLGHMWTASTPAGVISEPKFWKHIHSNPKVIVHRAEITEIVHNNVILSDGNVLSPDVHVWATGWTRNSTPITPPSVALACGAPVDISLVPDSEREKWSTLSATADQKVLQLLPILREAPAYKHIDQKKTPYRLYRFMVPPQMADHSLVYVGMLHTSATGILADLQALWAAVYLGNKLPPGALPSPDEMEEDIGLTDSWCRKRFLSLGEKCSNVSYEFIPYIDLLLKDLHVSCRRKRSFLMEWTSTYMPQDYKGVIDEVKARYGLGGKRYTDNDNNGYESADKR